MLNIGSVSPIHRSSNSVRFVVSFSLAIGLLLLFECLNIIHSSGVPMACTLLYEIANFSILDRHYAPPVCVI